MKTYTLKSIAFIAIFGLALYSSSAATPRPIRALLITGGCCHDYGKQKDILKKGIEARAHVIVDLIHSDDKSTKPPLPIYGNPDYAKGYDVVIHDECSSDIKDPAMIEGVLAPHRKGIAGVNLHCGMHSYRFGDFGKPVKIGDANSHWYEYLGLQSTGHGPQVPIAIRYTDNTHPLIKGLADWTTINEELYNNIQIFPTAKALASGKQTVKQKDGSSKDVDFVVTWVNDFKGTRVFSTTIGHNTATVEDARYLDLVTRGLLWSCGKLDDNGKPKNGYGPSQTSK